MSDEAERHTVVVEYDTWGKDVPGKRSRWGEGWRVAAWTETGRPLVATDDGLITVGHLIRRYIEDNDNVTWSLAPDEHWAPGVAKQLY